MAALPGQHCILDADVFERAKALAPGWDVYALEAE